MEEFVDTNVELKNESKMIAVTSWQWKSNHRVLSSSSTSTGKRRSRREQHSCSRHDGCKRGSTIRMEDETQTKSLQPFCELQELA
jgi:hypothetical protein